MQTRRQFNGLREYVKRSDEGTSQQVAVRGVVERQHLCLQRTRLLGETHNLVQHGQRFIVTPQDCQGDAISAFGLGEQTGIARLTGKRYRSFGGRQQFMI